MISRLNPRLLPVAAALLITAAGCAPQSEELLPIPASIKGASMVREMEVIVRPGAAATVARLDEKARSLHAGSPASATEAAALQFREMMQRTVQEVTRSWGLTAGRPLKLLVEIDEVRLADPAATILGGSEDRMAGSVFFRDAVTDEELGQLYVNVVNSHSGPVGLLIRGGGIREELATEFSIHIARALSGRRNRPR